MSTYDEGVAQHSGARLTTEDNRRTRYTNDHVRRSVERGEWLLRLFRVLSLLGSIATAGLAILHYLR